MKVRNSQKTRDISALPMILSIISRLKRQLIIVFSLSIIAFSFCKPEKQDKFVFEKIIFHSSRCFGTCPRIDLEIDSNQNVYVSREFFKTKGETEIEYSGQFRGSLEHNDYKKLITLLGAANLHNLNFPNVTCCDAPIITIIVYFNGQRKYFKSMTPPNDAQELVTFLKTIGTDKSYNITCILKSLEE